MISYKPLGATTASTLTYDNQGNIQTNEAAFGSNTYEYNDASHIHAVTKIGDENFTYDANGNMLTDNDRTMEYNAQNQLVRVTMKNGMVIEYDYDYTGARVKKHVTRTDTYAHVVENDTHFLGDAMEIKDDTLILNLYAGSQKIGIKALGTISELLGIGSGSLRQINISSPLRVATAMPYLLIGIALFLMMVMKPGVHTPLPLWERESCGREKWNSLPPWWGKVAEGRMRGLLFWRTFRQNFQDFIFALPHRKAAKAISFLLVLCFSLEYPIQAAFAADTGAPSQSDDTYFYYVHGDHLGSSHLMTEGNASGGKHSGLFYNQGDLIQRIEYQPFGQEKYVLNPNLQTDPSFTGQKYDIESGLYFYKSRYYNPKLARFIQPDTVNPDPGNSQAYNKYAYVANNPLKYVDPSGHSFGSWFKKLIGLVVTVVATAILTPFIGGIAASFVGALLGGLVGGAVNGGLSGAFSGMIMAAVSWGVSAGLSSGMNMMGISSVAQFAIMSGLGATVAYKTGGWQGLVVFGVQFAYNVGRMFGAAQFRGAGGEGGEAGGIMAEGAAARAGAAGYAAGVDGSYDWNAFDVQMAGEVSATGVMLASGSQTVFLGVRAVAIVGAGGGVNLGIYYEHNANLSWSQRLGVFGMPEFGSGLDVSASVEAGWVPGNLESTTMNVNIGGATGGISTIIEPGKRPPYGASGSVGKSLFPVSVSGTATRGYQLNLSQMWQGVSGIF